MADGPKYPNQQLRSVSLETYFPGRLNVSAVLGQIQESVEERLPNLYVPNVIPGEAVALRPVQLRDAPLSRSLAIATNQVTYIAFKYPGFEAFAKEAIPILSRSLDTIGPKKLNRVVYRYENEIGLGRDESGLLPVDQLFPGILPVVFSEGARKGRVKTVNSSYEHAWEEDGFKGVHGFQAITEDNLGLTVFKITVFGAVEDVEIAALQNATSKAHQIGFDLFDFMISPEFRKFISTSKEEP
jgi:uncharacterized protein (TIGR04255 family)